MAYDASVLQRAQARLDEEREQNELNNEARIAAIYERLPRLREIERELRKTAARVCAASFRAGEDGGRTIQRLKEENLSLQRERDWILESSDIDPEDLEAAPICPVCGGTGWRGAVMCDCLKELCRQEQKKELSMLLGTGRESFERFRLDVYPDAFSAELGTSPRELMQSVLNKAVRYAQTFSPASRSLFFYGATGLGKTFLSGCIAKAVAEKGYSVCYVSAGRLFSDFETQKFRPDGTDLTKRYFDCDLLILDDLGTEMTTQFTVSALYQIINERLMESKPVILSSNIPLEELEARYSAQIASRLLGAYTRFKFVGDDIRMMK